MEMHHSLPAPQKRACLSPSCFRSFLWRKGDGWSDPNERGIGIMTVFAVLDLVAKVLSISASGLTIYILISRKRSK